MKLIVCDLDGTLLNSEENIPESTKEYIRDKKRDGIVMVASTGRTLAETIEIEGIEDIADYIVSSDGASLLNVKENEFVYNKVIEKSEIEKLYEIVNYEHSSVDFYTLKGEKRIITENDIVNKVKLFFEDNKRIEHYGKIINEKYFDRYKALPMQHSARDEYWLAINNANTDKSTGLKHLKEMLNIDKKDILSFGDRPNDIANFKESGISVAMANATEQVKGIATITTSSNDELGVEKVLRNLLDESKN